MKNILFGIIISVFFWGVISIYCSYNTKFNLDSKTQTINTKQFKTSYSYDEHDRMTSQTYPSGKVIGYEYDDKGELVSMSIDGVPFITNIKTNDNGLLSYEYAGGIKHTREYDTSRRVTTNDDKVEVL